MNRVVELNFDGLVGPTHNYAGLSSGNLASTKNGGLVSNPREAALQGLAKMTQFAKLGLIQAVLPPHARPEINTLRRLGFGGSDKQVVSSAAKDAFDLLAACYSASNMWTANAATVVPSSDSSDHRVHFVPANLISKFHRTLESQQTVTTLQAIFRDESRFQIHEPLPGGQAMGDEGAANHTRFASSHAGPGLHLFVYGHQAFGQSCEVPAPSRYASRQSLEASQAVSRLGRLNESQILFAQQNPAAIDAGVFHNDVIAVGNENVLLYHEDAFVETPGVITELSRRFAQINPETELILIKVRSADISLSDAVKSYLFNSQLITLGPNQMMLCAPIECQEMANVRHWIEGLVSSKNNPVNLVQYFDLKQSMSNGGGPACLRLRIVLNDAELAKVSQGVILTDTISRQLEKWITKHYRDKLSIADLADTKLLEESQFALDELTKILNLGSIYPFQR